jgi:hypothetical protein
MPCRVVNLIADDEEFHIREDATHALGRSEKDLVPLPRGQRADHSHAPQSIGPLGRGWREVLKINAIGDDEDVPPIGEFPSDRARGDEQKVGDAPTERLKAPPEFPMAKEVMHVPDDSRANERSESGAERLRLDPMRVDQFDRRLIHEARQRPDGPGDMRQREEGARILSP